MKFALLFLVLAAAQATAATVPEAVWIPVPGGGNFPTIYRQEMVNHGTGIFSLGGYGLENSSRRVLHSSDGVGWETRSEETPWSPRLYFGAASFLGKLWILGGMDAGKNATRSPDSNIWTSTDGAAWEKVPSEHVPPWSGRYQHEVVVFGDCLWIIGGKGPDGELSEAWFTRDGKTWTLASTNVPVTDSESRTSVVHHDAIWLLASATGTGAVWSSPDGVRWDKVLHDAPWGNATPEFAASFDGLLWCYTYDSLWVSRDGRVWRGYPSPRSAGTRHLFQETFWLYGGTENDTVHQLDQRQISTIAADARQKLAAMSVASDIPKLRTLDWKPERLDLSQKARIKNAPPETHNGWTPIAPEHADAQRRRQAPAFWRGDLWALTEQGQPAFSPNGEHWFETDSPVPFLAGDDYAELGYSTAVYADHLWVLAQSADRDGGIGARFQAKGLWSTGDGEVWTAETHRLPENPGESKLIVFRDKLLLFGGSSVYSMEKESSFHPVTKSAPWAGCWSYGMTSHEDALYVVATTRVSADASGLHANVWRSEDGSNWTLASDTAPFIAREYPTLLSYRGYLWLAGGSIDNNPLSDVWMSKDGETWNQVVERAPWSPRALASGVVFQDRLFLVGGFPKVIDSVWITSDGKTWNEPNAVIPWRPRVDTALVEFKGAWWMLGGRPFDTEYLTYFPDIWRTTNWTDWTCVTDNATPFNREVVEVVATDQALWAVGVREQGSGAVDNRLWRSTDGATWNQMTAAAPWHDRYGFGVASFRDKLWILGGYRFEDYTVRESYREVYSTSDGIHWNLEGFLPRTADNKDRYRYQASVYAGALWLNVVGDLNQQFWTSGDGKNWKIIKTNDIPERYYNQVVLSHANYLWLLSGTGSTTDSDLHFSWEMPHWWRTTDGEHWEAIPFAKSVLQGAASYRENLRVRSTPAGLTMLDTQARIVYVWDEERAKSEPDELPPGEVMY